MKLILGSANFFQKYGVNNKRISDDEIEKIIKVAVDNGIKDMDTSTAYIDPESYPVKIIKSLDYKHYNNVIEMAHGFDRISDRVWDGVSVDTPEEALESARVKMKFIEFPFNVFNHEIMGTKFFNLTERYKLITIARSVFLQGLLLMDEPIRGKYYMDKLDKIIRPYGISRKEAVFLFTYNNSLIDYIVVGVDTSEQLKELIDLTKYELPWSLMENLFDMQVPDEIKYPWLWRK